MVEIEDLKRLRLRKARLLERSGMERHALDLELEVMRVRMAQSSAAWLNWPTLAKYALPAAAAAFAARRFAGTLGMVTKGSMGLAVLSKALRWWRRRRRR